MDSREFMVDVSKNEGMIDYAKLAAYVPKVRGLAARASISWGYQDAWFPHNKAHCTERLWPFMAYHVTYPKQAARAQMENFYRVAGEGTRKVIDFELAGDGGDDPIPAPPAQQAAMLSSSSDICLARDGIRPIIYSRYALINAWLLSWTSAMLNEHYYILAQYLDNKAVEHPGPPTLPSRVLRERVILHQTSDHKSNAGMGVPSKLATDTDRWVGVMSIEQFFGPAAPAPVRFIDMPEPQARTITARGLERIGVLDAQGYPRG